MSAGPAPPSPLEEHDPERARALKAKVRDRVGDVRRHLVALRTALAEFGEDVDIDAFRAAYASDDPVPSTGEGRRARRRPAVQLHRQLAALGLELAEVRTRDDALNARRDLQALHRIGVIGSQRAQRLKRLRELRRLHVHEHATATAEQFHEAARLVASEFIPGYDAYRTWIARGFAARPARR